MDAMAHAKPDRYRPTAAGAALGGLARARTDNDGATRDGMAWGGKPPARAEDPASPRSVPPQTGARAGAAELRHRRVRLTREPASAALARGEVRAALSAWEAGVDADLAVLLTSDLVTNAIVRGEGTVITLAVRCGSGKVRVDVYNTWRALPVVVEAGASSASGPGLALIDALASEWGTFRTPAGMGVYFALDCETELSPGGGPDPGSQTSTSQCHR